MNNIVWSYELYDANNNLLYSGHTSAWGHDLQMTFKHYAKRKGFWDLVQKVIVKKMNEDEYEKTIKNIGKFNAK